MIAISVELSGPTRSSFVCVIKTTSMFKLFSCENSLQVKDVTRNNCKGIVAASLDEVRAKVAEKFGKADIPNIHLDSDGTEIDDEDYFQTLEPNTELVAVFNGEQWIDVSKTSLFSISKQEQIIFG